MLNKINKILDYLYEDIANYGVFAKILLIISVILLLLTISIKLGII